MHAYLPCSGLKVKFSEERTPGASGPEQKIQITEGYGPVLSL